MSINVNDIDRIGEALGEEIIIYIPFRGSVYRGVLYEMRIQTPPSPIAMNAAWSGSSEDVFVPLPNEVQLRLLGIEEMVMDVNSLDAVLFDGHRLPNARGKKQSRQKAKEMDEGLRIVPLEVMADEEKATDESDAD